MKVKSALLGLAAASGGLLMSANVASADGYSAPARYVPAPTWTGCYIGIEGGWAWGHSEPKRLDINTKYARDRDDDELRGVQHGWRFAWWHHRLQSAEQRRLGAWHRVGF